MIWATVSSRSCFYWLYRASPSLAAKNIINLISVLTIWWCPCVESSLVLLEEGVCYDQCVLLAKLFSLCYASFRAPRPNLPVTPGISWLLTFAFQSPIMKRTSFLDISYFLHLLKALHFLPGRSLWPLQQMLSALIRISLYTGASQRDLSKTLTWPLHPLNIKTIQLLPTVHKLWLVTWPQVTVIWPLPLFSHLVVLYAAATLEIF